MTVTFTLVWWHMPVAVSILAALVVMFWPDDSSGMFAGLGRLFMAVPAMFVALVAWIIGALLK